jgi:hypothetical protein
MFRFALAPNSILHLRIEYNLQQKIWFLVEHFGFCLSNNTGIKRSWFYDFKQSYQPFVAQSSVTEHNTLITNNQLTNQEINQLMEHNPSWEESFECSREIHQF